MATPKIKVYRLDRGYSSNTDNDIQQIVNDELLPIVDKNLIPSDAYILYGVTNRTLDVTPTTANGSYAEEALLPINTTAITEILGNSGGQVQAGSVGNWINTGYYLPVLQDDTLQVIPKTAYTINALTGEVTFLNLPYPLSVTATYYTSVVGDATDWYTPNYPLYGRANYNYRERLFGGAYVPNDVTYLTNWNLTGAYNSRLYVTLVKNTGSFTVNVYSSSDKSILHLVCTGTGTLSSTITLTQSNSSGISGTVDKTITDASVNLNFLLRKTLYADSEYTINKTTGLITFTTAQSRPVMKFYQQTDYASIFVSDNPNWVYGHLRTNPDIFQGKFDYPGDDYIPVSQGPIPKFISTGFQVDYRTGAVILSSGWDSSDLVNPSPLPVTDRKMRANYAYYKNINNVTGQVLDWDMSYLNGYKYKANTEKFFPDSHGKRWVVRENYLMPQNFYDGAGNTIPELLTTNPYSILVAKSALSLANSATVTVADFKIKTYVIFTGTNAQFGTISINGNSFTFGKTNGNVNWQGTEYAIGAVITQTSGVYNFKVEVYDNTVISVYDFVQ